MKVGVWRDASKKWGVRQGVGTLLESCVERIGGSTGLVFIGASPGVRSIKLSQDAVGIWDLLIGKAPDAR